MPIILVKWGFINDFLAILSVIGIKYIFFASGVLIILFAIWACISNLQIEEEKLYKNENAQDALDNKFKKEKAA